MIKYIGKLKYWLLAATFLPGIAFAQAVTVPPVGLPSFGGSESVTDLITNIVTDIILPFVGIICVLFIIIGGFRYITSAGNDEQAAAGKKTLTNAIIGLVIIILSYVIVVVIANTLGNS